MNLGRRIVRWGQKKSPWILHFNTGACNACDIEIIAALTPRFDLERFGVLLKGTPAALRRPRLLRARDEADPPAPRPHLRADP